MGTRGTLEVYLNGELKIRQYNQWDSYPTGQLAGICEFLAYKPNVSDLAYRLGMSRFFTLEEVEKIEKDIVGMNFEYTNDFQMASLYDTLVNRDYGYRFLYEVLAMCPVHWMGMDIRYLIPDWKIVLRNNLFGEYEPQEGNYVIEITADEDGENASFVLSGVWHDICKSFPPNVLPTQQEIEQWEKEGYDNRTLLPWGNPRFYLKNVLNTLNHPRSMVLCTSTDGSIDCSYCTPEDVCKAIRIIDFYDRNGEILQPSDSSLPDYDELCFRISVAEKYIDKYTGRSWRENRAVNESYSLNTYWHDINALRSEYYIQGGYFIQLDKRPVRKWDPSKGDKLEIRTPDNTFVDISDTIMPDNSAPPELCKPITPDNEKAEKGKVALGWIDYERGKVYLRTMRMMTRPNNIRITYRWGMNEEVPSDIRRATALKVGLTLLDEELYMTRIGTGGDLGSAKGDLKRSMQSQISEILMMNRTFTPIYSAYD